ncbi:MAG TPA: right-handed parallel beta-helix repeat-containing protein [Coxiellaceae bacterium]|nr:right-handed parallel beta-helix repeat-containing protein [Coxiellaceae bacterium]
MTEVCGKKKLLISTNRKISKPGHYYLDKDIYLDDKSFKKKPYGIRIISDNVVLDFQGNGLHFTGGKETVNFGIFIKVSKNVKIINAKVIGFYYGLHAIKSKILHVENCNFEASRYIGICAAGENIYIENNIISNMAFQNRKAEDNYLIGMNINADKVIIKHNIIKNLFISNENSDLKLEYVGILIGIGSKNCLVENNQLLNNTIPVGQSYAIWCGEESRVNILNNILVNYAYDVGASQAFIGFKGHSVT